ncbi:hypothetical protein BDC45DRAFT_558816 [Circinella umbellata]|nr:hypothetical protein BDC45DRAFT_558816 [Circinella umbellata]
MQDLLFNQESTADTEEMGTDSESTTSDPDDNDEHDNYYTKDNEFEQDLYYLEISKERNGVAHVKAQLTDMIMNLTKVINALIHNLPDYESDTFSHRQTFADVLKTLNTSAQNIWNIRLLKRTIRKTARVLLRSNICGDVACALNFNNRKRIITVFSLVAKMESNVFQGSEELTTTISFEHESPMNEDIAEAEVQNLDDGDNNNDDDGDHTFEEELVYKESQKTPWPLRSSLSIPSTPTTDVLSTTIRCLEAVITMMSMSFKIDHRVIAKDVRKAIYSSTKIPEQACEVASCIINFIRPFVPKKKMIIAILM